MAAAIVYATITAGADKPLRRAIAFRTVTVATIVVLIFIVFGEFILGIFHISLPALKLAGGLILLLFALGMVSEAGPAICAGAIPYPYSRESQPSVNF
jgi:multiple antibiotic resistance protein